MTEKKTEIHHSPEISLDEVNNQPRISGSYYLEIVARTGYWPDPDKAHALVLVYRQAQRERKQARIQRLLRIEAGE